LIYKHSISTIMPGQPVDVDAMRDAIGEGKKSKALQDVFLSAAQRTQTPVTMFLVNGVMLQGDVATYDLFCLLLQRDSMSQLVYKHAISTVMPGAPISLFDGVPAAPGAAAPASETRLTLQREVISDGGN